jgi:uncharacterized membrane protein YozB (DUF420 family)
MTDQKARLHQWFHNFLVNFALWAFGAFAILYGIRFIYEAKMDGYSGSEFLMIAVVNILLIATGLFTIKTRFDLADFRMIALKELPGVCIAGAVICLVNCQVLNVIGYDMDRRLLLTAFILICWAFGLYRYYHEREYLFRD